MNNDHDELQRQLKERHDAMTPDQKARSDALMRRLEMYAGRLPLDWKFSRDEANER